LKDDTWEEAGFEETQEKSGSIETFFIFDSSVTTEHCSPGDLFNRLFLTRMKIGKNAHNDPGLPS
jgi:hypothetical protein